MSTKLNLSHLQFRPRNNDPVWDLNAIPFDERFPNHLTSECVDWCKEQGFDVTFDRNDYVVIFTNKIPNMINIVHATFADPIEAMQFVLVWGGEPV